MKNLQRGTIAVLILVVASMLLTSYAGMPVASATFGVIQQVSLSSSTSTVTVTSTTTSLTSTVSTQTSSTTTTFSIPSLSLNPSTGPIGVTVQVSGSGFSMSDYSCTLSGTVVSSQSCSVSGGVLTGTFTAANVPVGSYTVTGTGGQAGDSATASFTLASAPAVTFNPISASPGTTVQVSGTGFEVSDTSCSLSGSPASSPTCSVVNGALSGTFIVANIAAGFYTVTATGNPGGDSASSSFKVNAAAPSITLSPSTARAGATVQVSGVGFSPSDSACTLSGGTVVASQTCSITNGAVTASFVVANVATGPYTITVTGSPTSDSASTVFNVGTPVSITLTPGSGPPGFTVQVTGSGFSTNDASCTIASPAVISASCSISAGALTGSFVVANVGVGYYTVTATGSTGDFASATFAVAPYSAPAIPGFPFEAILAGLLLGVGAVILFRRRLTRN